MEQSPPNIYLVSRSIHITRNGEKFGPYKEETAREHLASGALKPTDLAWHKEADGWKPLSEVLAAAPATAAETLPPADAVATSEPPPETPTAAMNAPPPPVRHRRSPRFV